MLTICYTCGKKWCGKKCYPTTCDYRFICIKSAQMDFCGTCKVEMTEQFEKQMRIRRLLYPKRIRTEGDE